MDITKNLKLFKIYELNELNIVNWFGNRPVEHKRINPIKKYIEKHSRVEGIIYLAKDKKDVYHCYDGIHRYIAIRELIKQKKQYENLLGMIELYDISVLVDIMNYDETSIQERFLNINSSLPVPHLYTSTERELDKRHTIEDVWKYISRHYPIFVKTSRRTNIPNINCTDFSDKFYNILSSVELPFNTEKWIDILKRFNTFMEESSIMTIKQSKKCTDNDFYWFSSSLWDEKLIEFIINYV